MSMDRPPSHEDVDLARRAAAGQRAAMEQLCRAHYGSILRLLQSVTGDRALAQDLAQETFSRAIAVLDRYRAEASLRSWLSGIACNLARTDATCRRRRRALQSRQQQQLQAARDPLDLEANLDGERQRLRLYSALDRLSEDQRQAFVLRCLEQRSLEETSAILGVPVSTVSYRALRAETKLRSFCRASMGPTGEIGTNDAETSSPRVLSQGAPGGASLVPASVNRDT